MNAPATAKASSAETCETDEPSPEAISVLAYARWQQRGEPVGSPDEDWLEAERLIRESDSLALLAQTTRR